MSDHMSSLIRSLSDRQLLERLESVRESTDTELARWLRNEAARRGLISRD